MAWPFGPETTIVIGASAAPATECAAAYVQREVERRTGFRWEVERGGQAAAGSLVLAQPGDGAPPSPLLPEFPEEIALWCGGDGSPLTAYAAAGGPSTMLAAAGKLLRTMELRPGVAALPRLSHREHPAFPVRGHHIANHLQNTTADKWEWGHWEAYLTDLAAWGMNLVMVHPLHPERWHGVEPFADPPRFASPEHEAEFRRQDEIQLRLPALCRELGIRYGMWLPVNDIFPAEVIRRPELTKYGGPYVCPHIPEARERIRATREAIFSRLSHVDMIMFPSRDDGGCPACADCTPWGETYLELVREQAAQIRRHHPGCTVWLTMQGLTPPEAQHIVDWLDRERPEWVEGVAHGPYAELLSHGRPGGPGGVLSTAPYTYGGRASAPVNRVRAAVPGAYRVANLFDLTHVFRCQNPVYGMDPAVQHVWDREDGPTQRPREMTALHRAVSPPADGSIPYSEGDQDDLNKFLWSALDWDPARGAEEITAEYARWFFGPAVAELATTMLFGFEEALGRPLYGNPTVKECHALLDACEAKDPALRENWRWLLARIGVLMLDYLQQVNERDRRFAATLRYRVPTGSNFDPAPFLREGIRTLEHAFAETAALLDEIVWTRDRLYALHKLVIRGVPKLQQSTMKLDCLLERWREIVARLERGELASPSERRQTLVAAMAEFEESQLGATRGIGLVPPIQEFAWQQNGPERKWHNLMPAEFSHRP